MEGRGGRDAGAVHQPSGGQKRALSQPTDGRLARQQTSASGGIRCRGSRELTSTAMLAWTDRNAIAWHYIAPGKPQ
jgi:hypothetical protein